jgi:hypothetical protein
MNIELLLGLAVLVLVGVVLYGVKGTKKTEEETSVETTPAEEKSVIEEAPVKKPRKARAIKTHPSKVKKTPGRKKKTDQQ